MNPFHMHMKVVCGVGKDAGPTRNDRASRSLGSETCYAETLSSGFQVLPCRSRQEDEGKLGRSRHLEEEGVGPPVAGRGSQALP